jgi:DNA-binding LytR/AlgR family response regulator
MDPYRIHVGSWKKLAPKDIIFLEGEINYTHIFLANGKKLFVATTLGILESRLANYRFFRTNRSTMINLDFVLNYEDKITQGTISLKNNKIIQVSRRKNRILKNII